MVVMVFLIDSVGVGVGWRDESNLRRP
jgi:hypothetical protein